MIKEQLVSFEVAQLLKAKGFNVIVTDSYRANGQLRGDFKFCNYPAPTQQMAMRWLREKHGRYISITPIFGFDNDVKFEYTIDYMEKNDHISIISEDVWDSYEDAVEYAIKDCLNNDFYETRI